MAKITNAVIYNEVLHIKEHVEKIEKHLETLNGKVTDHSLAIERIQTRQNVIWGIFAAVGAALVNVYIKLIGGK